MLEPVPRLRTVRETVPAWVEQAVARALARAPADRFATAAELVEALATPRTATAATAPPDAAPQPVAPPAGSIAVLPFVNLSADPENEYFSEGMTEEIINALTRVAALRVASRTFVCVQGGGPGHPGHRREAPGPHAARGERASRR